METITIAGAQIPVSYDYKKNVIAIKEAIDYAKKVDAHYLVTPEGSLSGFITDFDTRNGRSEQDLIDALHDVVNYAQEKSIGLFLGTMWLQHENNERVRRNQIRVYDREGNYIDHVNKTLTMPEYEKVKPNEYVKPIFIPEMPQVAILCLLCNDMWGCIIDNGPCIPKIALEEEWNLMIHCTNGLRNPPDPYNPYHDDIFGDWHNAWLKMMSLHTRLPIVTCDNSIHMHGEEYDGPTSSQSGVVSNGVWRTDVPRTGTQYFHYTFSIPRLIFRTGESDYSSLENRN